MMNLGLMDPAFLGGLGGERDPYFSNVSLLLHGNGANGSTSIIDSSPSPKTVTAVGNAQISTAQSKFGGASIAFDGNADSLTSNYSNAYDLPGDFTLEAFVSFAGYSASYSSAFGAAIMSRYQFPGAGNTGWQLRINGTASSYTTINLYTGLTDLNFTLPAVVSLNTFYHFVANRKNGVISAFMEGLQAGLSINNTDNFTRSASNELWIGGLNDATYRFWLNGYIDELRITKGIARYEVGTGANAGKMVHAGTNILALPTAPFPDA